MSTRNMIQSKFELITFPFGTLSFGTGDQSQWKNLNCSLFLIIIAAALPIPQLYVILLEKSGRYCEQPLLAMAIASTVLTFFTIGFTFLFCLFIPVPRSIKIVFHVFSVGCIIHGLMTAVYTFQARDECSVTVPELFFLSEISSYFGLASLGFLTFMFPFWILNVAKKNLVLDPYSRTGVCYEPVKCCSCLWHI